MRQTKSLPPPSYQLLRRVFAGCHQSLLEAGPSRHYPCNPCVGAWTPTPQCPSGALARFFPEDNGLTSDVTRSAHQHIPIMQLQPGIISGLQSFRYVQAPTLARPPGCTHRSSYKNLSGRAVYTTHRLVGCLPQDVASLRIRHEQLIRLDFHQLDCSLVGRSDVPIFSLFIVTVPYFFIDSCDESKAYKRTKNKFVKILTY